MKKINKLMAILFICLLQNACLGKVATETTSKTETISPTVTFANTSEPKSNPTAILALPSPTLASEALSTQITQPSSCDMAEFVSDVTVADGTVFKPGEIFTKTWRFKNVGSCTWTTDYKLVFKEGDLMDAVKIINLPNEVPSGQTLDISVDLVAPVQKGSYRGYWELQNTSGAILTIRNGSANSLFYVDIAVTPDVAVFTITVDAIVVTCEKPDFFTATATITSNEGGTILYDWGTDGLQPYPSEKITFGGATTTTITKDIPFAAVDPNHPEWNNIYLFILEPQKIRTEVLRQCP